MRGGVDGSWTGGPPGLAGPVFQPAQQKAFFMKIPDTAPTVMPEIESPQPMGHYSVMAPLRIARLLALVVIGAPAPAQAQFIGTDLRLIAGGAGARDRPVVVTSTRGYAIAWSETIPPGPAAPGEASARILRLRLALDGSAVGPADTLILGAGTPLRPALAASPDATWLAWEFQEPGMRPGDRDLALRRYAGFLDSTASEARITRERAPAPVVTQGAPALLFDPAFGGLVMANTWGALRPARREIPPGYDSVNVEIRVLRPDGTAGFRFTVKGPDEVGEAGDPFLGFLPPGWRERYILAYTSNGGRRQHGAAGRSVYLELFGEDWRVLGGRHMAWPEGGASRPSVAAVAGRLYLAWAEDGSGEVMLSELDDELWPRRPMRLRDALAGTPAGEELALDHPPFSAPVLFDDFGMLGIAFVATRTWQPAHGRVRQEVWLARLHDTRP